MSYSSVQGYCLSGRACSTWSKTLKTVDKDAIMSLLHPQLSGLEHRSSEPRVVGSSPSGCALILRLNRAVTTSAGMPPALKLIVYSPFLSIASRHKSQTVFCISHIRYWEQIHFPGIRAVHRKVIYFSLIMIPPSCHTPLLYLFPLVSVEKIPYTSLSVLDSASSAFTPFTNLILLIQLLPETGSTYCYFTEGRCDQSRHVNI